MQARDSGNNIFIITIDLEDWFHILDIESLNDYNTWDQKENRIYDNTFRILKFFQENNVKATFFALGWIAKKYPDLLLEVSKFGHEIGSHSMDHLLIYNSNRDLFEKDLINSIDTIQSVINKKVRSFRAPGFSIKKENLWALEIISKAGIEVDSSIFPAARGHGGIKDFPLDHPFLLRIGEKEIREFPINVFRFGNIRIPFSGGGYFRLFPYFIIKSLAEKSPYVMSYFHPRDFDLKQPIIEEMPLLRKFKTYYGLKSSFKKFMKYIKDFNFVDLSTAEKKINWNNVPIVIIK